jgi:HEAT repeat protein
MRILTALITGAALITALSAQDPNSPNPKDRAKAARELEDSGADAIPQLTRLVSDPDLEVRRAAVNSIIAIGTQHSINPLVQAARDNDPEIQIRATDGLVNFYLPGYVQRGWQRLGAAIRDRFNRENRDVIEPYITVREDVIQAIGRLARGGSSMESRANAARAIGILRGKEAIPDLLEALKTKDDAILFETLIALQKIRDVSAGLRVDFLLSDLNERVQVAAIETAGLLQNREATGRLRKIYDSAERERVKEATMTALAMLPEEASRPYFQRGFADNDEEIRAAAAEGYARLKNAGDVPMLDQAFNSERKMKPRLAVAFGLVSLGRTQTGEFSPLRYLVNTLNSRQYRHIAQAYLNELARQAPVREAIYPLLRQGTKDERAGLARALGVSGDAASVPHLEAMTRDPEIEMAREAITALRTLKARLP